MEIIPIAGYTHNEKKHILERYLLPTAVKNAGLLNSDIKFNITENVKDFIIQNYCREPGVRSLKKFINKVTEKLAFQMVDTDIDLVKSEIVVDVDNIEKYIGHPLYRSSKFYGHLPPPVSFN